MPINPSPAVLRAGQLLRTMAGRPHDSYSVSELSRLVGIPRATCDSILQALMEHGLVVRQEPALRYELGAFCIALGDAARVVNPILNAASREADDLAQRLSACVAVSAKVGGETRVMSVSDWGPPLGLRPRPGQSMPLVPPLGAVFVAWNDAEAAAWLAHVEQETGGGQGDRWREALAAIRLRGYSITLEDDRTPEFDARYSGVLTRPHTEDSRQRREELLGRLQHTEYLTREITKNASVRLTHISAPVFDTAGQVAASVMLLGPQRLLAESELYALGQQVADAAGRASKSAGSPSTA